MSMGNCWNNTDKEKLKHAERINPLYLNIQIVPHGEYNKIQKQVSRLILYREIMAA
jgi:hypothetical protein